METRILAKGHIPEVNMSSAKQASNVLLGMDVLVLLQHTREVFKVTVYFMGLGYTEVSEHASILALEFREPMREKKSCLGAGIQCNWVYTIVPEHVTTGMYWSLDDECAREKPCVKCRATQ